MGEQEEWKTIPWTRGMYSVSSLGRIRRDAGGRGTRAGKILQQGRHPQGYAKVGISLVGEDSCHLTHSLVAEAFLGPRPDGKEVNHINGVKTDNRAVNIEWVTRQENIAHSVRTGLAAFGDRNGSRTHPERIPRGNDTYWRKHPDLVPRGESRGQAKLTDEIVRAMRAMRASGLTYAAIAAVYGVSEVTVYRVIVGQRWGHVK